MQSTRFQQNCIEYNNVQTQTGAMLKTLKGSLIRRSKKHEVGKIVGNNIYFHRDYCMTYMPKECQFLFQEKKRLVPFDFNCCRYNVETGQLAFVESPDFDVSREPLVGRMFIVNRWTDPGQLTQFYNQIYHHKWTFVDNCYSGFHVRESWEWSRTWLNVLTEPANGSSLTNWLNQLSRFNLQ